MTDVNLKIIHNNYIADASGVVHAEANSILKILNRRTNKAT